MNPYLLATVVIKTNYFNDPQSSCERSLGKLILIRITVQLISDGEVLRSVILA